MFSNLQTKPARLDTPLNPAMGKQACLFFWGLYLTSVTCTNLCGLSLLLKLLELLRCDKTDRFVSGYELGACRHGGQDDVPAQATDTA